MNCPECRDELVGLSVVGTDQSFRCKKCGGVWMAGWVLNKIAEGGRLKIENRKDKTKINPDRLACPEDKVDLVRGEGEGLPPTVKMWKCPKCKYWWLPGNSIFELAEAFAVRDEYRKRWRISSAFSVFTIPVVLTVVLVAGLGLTLAAIKNSQQIGITAASPVVGKISVLYLGENRAEIRFRARGELETAWYKREYDDEWLEALVLSEGEWKAILVSGVNPAEKIWLSINNNVWRLMVGQRQ